MLIKLFISVEKLLINPFNFLFFNVSRETIYPMAGLYVHIPFCFSRCGYCDFFKTTQLRSIPQFVENLKSEIALRAPDFNFQIDTIYFGGGTPSLLKPEHLTEILNAFKSFFLISDKAEITIECNPDDLSVSYLNEILNRGFNRLSIGIQSFNDLDLQKMQRRHNSHQAKMAVDNAIKVGFNNIGVDFIYGLPWSNRQSFLENLAAFQNLPVQHISAYHLTIEKGTSFFNMKRNGLLNELSDVESLEQYLLLCDGLGKAGKIHYEVSNFCIPGYFSQHNTSYWKGVAYLGFGPGSHSFVENKRFWNKSNLKQYLTSRFDLLQEEETLSRAERYNEMIMLGLRTMWGINMEHCNINFTEYFQGFNQTAEKWIDRGWLTVLNNHLICKEEHWFQVDRIIEDFLIC